MAFLGGRHTGSFIEFLFSYSHGPVLRVLVLSSPSRGKKKVARQLCCTEVFAFDSEFGRDSGPAPEHPQYRKHFRPRVIKGVCRSRTCTVQTY